MLRRSRALLLIAFVLVSTARGAGGEENELAGYNWQICAKPFCGADTRFHWSDRGNDTAVARTCRGGAGMRILALTFNMGGSGFVMPANNTFTQVQLHPITHFEWG